MILQADKNCFKYSENSEALKELLENLIVTCEFMKYDKYFKNDKDYRNIYKITIKRGNISISFSYGDSVYNSINKVQPSLYDILACCKTEYDITDTYENFCDEFGYEKKTSKNLFDACKKQSDKLKKIFTETEIECLPS